MDGTTGGYDVRRAVKGDLDAVVSMVEAGDIALGVVPDATKEFLSWLWRIPATDLERDTRVARHGGEVAAFAQGTWRSSEGGPMSLFVRVHPDHRGAGLDARLMAWGESLARERGTHGVRAVVPERDRGSLELLMSRGYRRVRSFYTMGKALSSDEEAGAVPEGVTLRPFEPDDERTLFDVHEASFADHWGFRPGSFEEFVVELYGEDWDPSLVFLAEADGAPVGHLIAFRFQTQGYVGMLGVIPSWRGHGIATALLRRAFAAMARSGLPEVSLGVDAQNPHGAVALYEGAGMTVRRRDETFDLATEDAAKLSSSD